MFLLAAMLINPWTLVWSDEFDVDGLPDPKKWTYEFGHIRNEELQYYTVGKKENSRVEGGNLVIECRKEADGQITSASLITLGKASWRYGRFEMRAKVPAGKGTWPAIWMMGTDRPKVGWPYCGEIDIMEYVGFDPNKVHGTVHFPANDPARPKLLNLSKGSNLTIDTPVADSFHVYAVEWSAEKLDFYFDGKMYFSFKNDGSESNGFKFDKEVYLLMNLAFGGTWGASKGVDMASLPAKYLIDYVRIYKAS